MNQIWACEIEHLRAYCDKVLCASDETAQAAALAFTKLGPDPSILSISGDQATIEINGMLSKNGPSIIAQFLGFGGTSYREILESIAAIKSDESIKTVVLAVDSPGGEIDRLDDIWIALRDLGASKRVIAENRGLMASAAYWIASSASHIVATSPAAETGSIGVRMTIYDFSEADSKAGVREIHIISTNAPNKIPDAKTDEGRAVYQAELDAIERVFISRISSGRGVSTEKIIEDFGQGKLLIASDPDKSMKSAVSVGMIDKVIGGFERKNVIKIDRIPATANISESTTPNIPGKVEKKMTLQEFLATDSSARAEVEAREIAAYQRGVAETQKRGIQASAILAGSVYPETIRAMAGKVLAGEITPDALAGAVSFCDSQTEAEKARLAAEETKKAGATPPETPTVAIDDGEVRSDEDHRAAVNRVRAAQGQKEIK